MFFRRAGKCTRDTGWCPWCYEGVRGRASHRGHLGYRAPRRVNRDMALSTSVRRAVQEAVPGGVPAAEEDTGALKAYPLLQGFLRETAWEDGAARQTATLMLFAEDGRWKVMLNDRDAGCVCFVSGDSVAKCLGSVEKGLQAGNLDWRRSKQAVAGKRKA